MKYIKQLDSLRAIAVLLVMISHWSPKKHYVFETLGFIGVNIFFVLSGFLITSILLNNKEKALNLGIGKKQLVKNFYAKRVLRIFPIYYLTIFFLYFLGNSLPSNIENSIGYHLTYTSNFYFYNAQHWDHVTSHLWSLSVEEQFYLIWPWIVLFINNKFLKNAIYIFIAIGIFSQFMAINSWNILLPSSCFDAFGLGALLSWNITFNKSNIKKFYKRLSIVIIPIVCGVFIIGFTFGYLNVKPRFVISLLMFWMLTAIILKKESTSFVFRYLWNNKFLIFLGKISYGLYLYHNILPHITVKFREYLPVISQNIHLKTASYIMWDFALVILISWISFKFIEQPFLRLKKSFRLKTSTS